MLQDIVLQLTGRAKRDGAVYVNTENIIAVAAYLALGWIISSIIASSIVKAKTGDRFASFLPAPIKGVKYLVAADDNGEFFVTTTREVNDGRAA